MDEPQGAPGGRPIVGDDILVQLRAGGAGLMGFPQKFLSGMNRAGVRSRPPPGLSRWSHCRCAKQATTGLVPVEPWLDGYMRCEHNSSEPAWSEARSVSSVPRSRRAQNGEARG
jgi:hypothetical protein